MKQIAAVELERCVALASLLDEVKPEEFDLKSWVREIPRPRQTILLGMVETSPACGFAGCAMGWAAYRQIFPGLVATTNGTILYQRNGGYTVAGGWDAVTMVMGLNRDMAYYLFSVSRYKTNPGPAQVAARLRRFIGKIEAIRSRDRRRAAPEQPRLQLVA